MLPDRRRRLPTAHDSGPAGPNGPKASALPACYGDATLPAARKTALARLLRLTPSRPPPAPGKPEPPKPAVLPLRNAIKVLLTPFSGQSKNSRHIKCEKYHNKSVDYGVTRFVYSFCGPTKGNVKKNSVFCANYNNMGLGAGVNG